MIQYPFLPTGTPIHSNRVIYVHSKSENSVPDRKRGGKVEPLDLHSLRDCSEHTL